MQLVLYALYGTPNERTNDWATVHAVAFEMHCMCDIKYDHCAYYSTEIENQTICSCWCWLETWKKTAKRQWCTNILQSITGVCICVYSEYLCSVIRVVIHFVGCKWYFIETLIEINDEKWQFTFPDGIEWIINLDYMNARRMFWMCANLVNR